MKTQEKLMVTRLGLITAKSSFIMGTLIFMAHCILKNDSTFILGFFYLLMAILINMLMLVSLLISLLAPGQRIKEVSLTIAILFINIPIALLYCWLALEVPFLKF